MVTKDVAIEAEVARPGGSDRGQGPRRHDGHASSARRAASPAKDSGLSRRSRGRVRLGRRLGGRDQAAQRARPDQSLLTRSSSLAYFARRVFWPTELNRTTSFWSSSSSSTLITGADAELPVLTRHAGAQAAAAGLILVLVHERRRLLARAIRAPRCAAVRIGAILPAAAARRPRRRRRTTDSSCSMQIGRDLLEEARRLGGLVLAEHPPPRRAGQHQPRAAPG